MRFRCTLAIAVLAILIGCAHQEDVIILDQRLSKVEALGKKLDQKASSLEKKAGDLERRDQSSGKEIEQSKAYLNTKLSEFEKDLGDEDMQLRTEYAKLNAGVETLKDDVQLLRGRLEESEFMIQERLSTGENIEKGNQILLHKLSINLNQIETRLQYIEQYLNLESSGGPSAKKNLSGKAEKTLTDQERYIAAKQAFDQDDFETARSAFEGIIKDFPKSEHADNAQFWIGEIYYREKWYEKAILEYQKVIENYPKGNKVPASLLKQGFSFISLGDKANARLILRDLSQKYPESNEGKIELQKLKEFQ
ncbi:MAG: tol-pal system protein YbgF [Desulfobacterales bacterium]|nr:tol-pal system protein YbgF [Desulfobacterales bacterium]MDX2511327.1 tol-pal system protein YbgF [Desulfobacterales bacterium]